MFKENVRVLWLFTIYVSNFQIIKTNSNIFTFFNWFGYKGMNRQATVLNGNVSAWNVRNNHIKINLNRKRPFNRIKILYSLFLATRSNMNNLLALFLNVKVNEFNEISFSCVYVCIKETDLSVEWSVSMLCYINQLKKQP